ncbi:hypothetical protein ACFQ7A_03415 [Streptomyces sp. NPDC056528]|uniref:hypothetical protein n=1 Tax=Streptomyces sp. NPDC056528 TaxID=3345854 RepID=UPI0036B479A2
MTDIGSGRIIRLIDPLTGLPGAKARSRAADWALRQARGRGLAGMTAGTRMTALTLLAHTRPDAHDGVADVHQVAGMRAVSVPELLEELRRLVKHRLLAAWALDPLRDELSWQLPD